MEEYDHSELEEDAEHEDNAHDHPLVDGLCVRHFGRFLSVGGLLLFCVLLSSSWLLLSALLLYSVSNEYYNKSLDNNVFL